MILSNIDFGDGWKGEIDQYATTKKRGKFYSVFCERPLAGAINTNEMWNFRFARKDNVNDYGFFQYRIQKDAGTDNEEWTDTMFKSSDGTIKNHTVPKLLLDFIENIELKTKN